MDIDLTYQTILQGLHKQGRGLIKLPLNEIPDLIQALKNNLTELEQLKKILCILTHTTHTYKEFEGPLLDLLGTELPVSHLVFTIEAIRKHCLEARFKMGERLPMIFFDRIKVLLAHRNLEVVEWALRLLEESGSQSVLLKPNVLGIKPPFWTWGNRHARSVRELVTLLERRWSRYDRQ